MVDSIFLLSVVTVASGLVGLCIRYCFRSKCSNMKCCWGFYEVTRDVQQEIAISELERQSPSKEAVSFRGDESPRSERQGRIGATYDA